MNTHRTPLAKGLRGGLGLSAGRDDVEAAERARRIVLYAAQWRLHGRIRYVTRPDMRTDDDERTRS